MSRRARTAVLAELLSAAVGLGACSSREGTATVDSAISYDTTASQGEFSFFAVSLKFIKSKAPCTGTDGKTCLGGLGGDLRNGKSNGIDGADSLCAEAAQLANPGDRHLWRAFLSAGNYNGAVLNAIDRIGTGPWYSAPPQSENRSSYASEGLLFAKDKAGLLKRRPDGDSTTIVYTGINQSLGAGNAQPWPFNQCLLNEYGYCTQADGDTHDTLTGTKNDGTYAGSAASTCDDWTNGTKGYGAPVYGHTWPRQLNATDNAAQWIDIGENLTACGAVINVSSTNYGNGTMGPGSASDGGMGGGMGPGFPDDGGMGPAGPGGGGGPRRPDDGGMGPGGPDPFVLADGGMMPPFGIGDGGMGPGGIDPFGPRPDDAGTIPGAVSDDNMGAGSTGGTPNDSTYSGGVGSGGGYGGFYCFALITGTE